MITFAYVLGLISIIIGGLIIWGGFAEEERGLRLAQRTTTP
jgi:hypothetical protein